MAGKLMRTYVRQPADMSLTCYPFNKSVRIHLRPAADFNCFSLFIASDFFSNSSA